MKILVFIPYYFPHIGGIENYSHELHQEFIKRGAEIHVLTTRLPSSASSSEIIDGVFVHRFPAKEIVANFPMPVSQRRYRDYTHKLAALQFDVVVSHTRFFLTSFLAIRFSKKHNIPLVHIEHGSSPVKHGNLFISCGARLWDMTMGKYILDHADYCIAISHAVSQFIKSFARPKRMEVIYRGMRPTGKIDPFPLPDAILNQKKIILCVSRLISGKGISDLLQALQVIKDRSWHCLLVGDGPEKENLIKKAHEMGLSSRVTFLGEVPSMQMLSLYRQCYMVVQASHSEGLPTAVLEAASLGKAIVATNVGGTNEVIENQKSGLLVPVRAPKALGEKISWLLDREKEAEEFGKAAKAFVEVNFSWEKTATRFESVFRQVYHEHA